jgi:AcrR family transcriptional regulator
MDGVTTTKKRAYHHGDLASALTDVATDLAREGGPGDVVLREAARRVGVSATAAYRHFAAHRDLIHAVKDRALGELAAAMRADLDAGTACADPVDEALRRLRGLGRTYVAFAMREAGLFRTAFCPPDADEDDASMEDMVMIAAPYQMLSETLDELAALGVLPATHRPFGEIKLWATVHGLAQLMLDGPLRALPEEARSAIVESALTYCQSGLGIDERPTGAS